MAHILFAWELGGGYGHLDRMFRIGDTLEATGHQLSYVVRDLPRAELLARKSNLTLLQAPYYARSGAQLPAAINYSDILVRCGFAHPTELSGLVRGWQHLYKLIKPDLLLCDHSPTALLAARFMNIPACSAAQGFFTPPVNVNPFPSLQPWNSISEQQLTQKDSAALSTINQVAANFSSPPLSQMGQLFDLHDHFLCSFPELEHYQDRPDGQYCGPIFSNSGQPFTAWEESTGPKIFIYLSAAQKQFKSLIQQLRTSPYKVLIHPRDINWQHTNQSIDQSLYISPMPVDMSRVARHADLIICHGGFGTCTASLLAGIPLLILPQQLEQTLFGYSLAKQQLASMMTDSPATTNWINLIEQLLTNETIKKRVSGFQEKYSGYDMQQACDCISAGVQQVLKG